MIKYRPHRGNLIDSMDNLRTFTDISDMLSFIELDSDGLLSASDIVISESYGIDNRIGWKSWRYVCTKSFGKEQYETPQCIGMCDLGEKG